MGMYFYRQAYRAHLILLLVAETENLKNDFVHTFMRMCQLAYPRTCIAKHPHPWTHLFPFFRMPG